ncbi:MAG: histidinol-phosphate transaminase [Acidimicrobiia bacterium]|nr:histidinol-phosphate transaminase [Acidimicrobiia bacterium]
MGRPRVRDDLATIPGYHSPQVAVDVRLNTNESPVPPPQDFTEALLDELATTPWHRYPDRDAIDLRKAIGTHHGVPADMVLAANGSNEILQAILLAYGGPGRSAATFEPTYAMHAQIARATATNIVQGQRRADFTLAAEEVRRIVGEHRPAITFLCSPNNPTGTVDPPDLVQATLAAVADHDGLVVVDEAYGQFSPHSALTDVRDDRALAVTRTYSKIWAMAGVRVGYVVAPSWLIADLEKVVLPYHLDVMTQAAGRIALRFVDEMHARVAALVEERGRLITRLSDLDVDVFPSGANFVLFRPRDRSGDQLWQELLDRSILVRNCASWPRLQDCLRVTIGTVAEDDRFLDALEEILQ